MQLKKAPLPTWLQPLLANKFFGQCEGHINEKKSEQNHFCMDCSCLLCPNCLTEHTDNGGKHDLLQIRHYVHSDVVRVNDVFKVLDIENIQPYVANGAKVIHLNPKNSKPYPEGVPKSYIDGTPCIICARAITKPNLFCSIACKVTEYTGKGDILSIETNEDTCDGHYHPEACAKLCSTEKEQSSSTSSFESVSEKTDKSCFSITSYRKKSQKGVPVRSPFF